jgi:hypothetical protein
MWDTRARWILSGVSDQVLRIAVNVDWAGEKIRGQVCDRVQAPRPFWRWPGLIGALDSMMGSPGRVACARAEQRRRP